MELLIVVIAIVIMWIVMGIAVYIVATHVWMRHAIEAPAHGHREGNG